MAAVNIKIPDGFSMRLARPSDNVFLESLHNSTRDDLRLIDGEPEFIESLIEMQFKAQTQGYGDQFPNAMYLIVEKLGERVGHVAVDFGHNEVRIIDIALIRAARGKGYGAAILKSMQMTAAKVGAPLTLTVLRSNPRAAQLYFSLGFKVEQSDAIADLMVWYPTAADMGISI